MDIEHNLIKGCPLCDIFLEPKKNIITKLYYPSFDEIKSSEFVIVDCKTCKIPMVVIRDHVTDLSRSLWGRILYTSKKEFGYNMKLRYRPRTVKDHWHAHIILPKEY